jgi:protein involved in polysaccharide export with SLBB domain
LPTTGQTTIVNDPKIHPGDLIEIDQLGGFDFDWRGRLNPEGYLDGLAKVADPIFGRCKTVSELAELIRSAYSKTLRDPRVIVRILDRSQRPLAIFDGAVRQPMRLQIRRKVALTELVVIAGGFTDRASGEVTVLRPPHQSCETSNESTEVLTTRVSDILEGKPGANLEILSGDIVNVRIVEPVYVVGGVNNPGKIDWRDGATVSRTVAAAGGVSGRGVTGNVSIFRREQGVSRVIQVDLDKVLRGGAEDVLLRPRDIIDVPLKGDPQRTAPPVVEAEESRQTQSMPIRVIE